MVTEQEEFEIFQGMEEVNRAMAEEIEAAAPFCHMRKMSFIQGDAVEGPAPEWWECEFCGHTKGIRS